MSGDLGDNIVAELRAMLKARWQRFNAEERRILQDASAAAADIAIQSLAGTMTADKAERERRQVTAQIANVRSAAEGHVVEFFWTAVRLAVRGALTAAAVL